VQRSAYDKIVSLVEEKSRSIIVGDPQDHATQLGPLCTAAQVENIEAVLKKAIDQGATIRFGGQRPEGLTGNYFNPTLVECRQLETETFNVEMFGPVMSLMPFDTEEDAIALANQSEFGLGSGVFTQNISRAHRVSADHQ